MKTAFLILLSLWPTTKLIADALPYPIVDTHQKHAYDDRAAIAFPSPGERFFGQDAQFASAQPNYRDNGDGTVTDRITGLMWTQTPLKASYQEAMAGTKTCDAGGYLDWRVPSIKEIYSLMQFSGLDPDPNARDTDGLTPFIDTSVFNFEYGNPADGERIIDSQFVTTTPNVSPIMQGQKSFFGLNLADGRIKAYPMENRRGNKYRVLYVRGNAAYGQNQFRDNGDGTISDLATGLMWMKGDSPDGMDWPSALQYAESMELAGYDDWRLPNAKELQSIVDYSRSPEATDSAAIDPIFESTAITNEGGQKDFGHYWTSTTHLKSRGVQDNAVYFAFGKSLGWMPDPRTRQMTLLDVHGAGSQRADPKVGDAARYPQGRGPQGDVVRIQNRVRLVRSGNAQLLSSGPPLSAPAQPAAPRDRGEGPRGLGPRDAGPEGNRFLERFDANGDKQVTREEFTGPANRFNSLDSDGNGVIDEQEAFNAPPPQGPGRPGGAPRGPRGPADEQGAFDARPPPPGPPALEGAPMPPLAPDAARKPNFVFIYADDMGWTGTSVEMIPGNPRTKSDYFQTPNLEKLAAQGMRFSAAYAPSSMCTPSRAAVLTGKTPAELHITAPGSGLGDNSRKLSPPTQLRDLPESETTIAEALAPAGYASAYFGKWHLGSGHPGQHGFHVHDGSTSNETPANTGEDNPKDIFGINQRAIAFIRENADAGRPFYVQLFHYAVHIPTATRSTSHDKFDRLPKGERHQDPAFAGMTWDLDQSIGTLMEELVKLGIARNTYIVFMSDNGAPSGPRNPLNNAPLNRGKATLYEGGLRVPLIVAGPGIPPNSHSPVSVTGCDLFPTFCEWAGVPVSGQIEGTSLAPLLNGKADTLKRPVGSLLFHLPHYGRAPLAKPASAIVAGDYKLIKDWENETYALFNLANDLGEQNDLSRTQPERLRRLIALMEMRLASVDAQLPVENPDYDPNATPPQQGGPGGRGPESGQGSPRQRLAN